ncbi:MAG: T9SS type A sorting domain-containing protein, partial [Williamsia sp.]|nr:T9SS type A sorting domain-containing protein [Williamsia sp.]
SIPYTVTTGNVTTIELPNDVQCDLSSTILNNGIHVTANDEVTVYGLNRREASTDAFLGLPTDILGTEYINLGYSNVDVVNGTQFGIVATQNGTTVTITPTVATDSHLAGVPYSIVLDQGQTYLLRNTGSFPSDLTGSIITSDKPIAVFGGHKCANIPQGYYACDYIVEELPPASTWGKNFVTVPLKTRTAGDTFRMLASTDNTEISINGSFVVSINRGQYYETVLTAASQITSTQPILVAQYSNSSTYDNVTSDPFEMLIPPYEQFLNKYTITTPAEGFAANFVNVVVPSSAVGGIILDGSPIPAASFSAIGSSGFSGAQVDIALGVHNFSGSAPFGVFVYGYDDYDSYGYAGGESVAEIARVTSVSLSPETGSGAVGTNHCFTASVRDQFSAPVAGVRVDFMVMGANAGTTGFSNTGAGGNTDFCYTGTNAGIDTIIGSVGTLSDTSYFTWTKGDNIAPTFTYPPTPADGTEYDVMVGQSVNFSVEASDADAGDNVALTATGIPSGATSTVPANGNPVSGSFSWTPGAGDVGTYTIQYKADDGNGGTTTTNVIVSVSSTCDCDPNFQTHIGVIPKYTVKGQDYHTIYKGYGPQRVVLLAAHHGGTAPYKYEWSDGATAHARVVSPDVTTTYSVTITDAHGCKSTSCVTVYVVDVRCGSTPGNIYVCNNGETMSVPKDDVQKWLSQGAKLGQCNTLRGTPQTLTARTAGSVKAITAAAAFSAYPNPAKTDISFNWSVPSGSNARVVITDLQGRTLLTQSLTNSPQRISISQLSNGVYMAKLVTSGGTIATTRFMVTK